MKPRIENLEDIYQSCKSEGYLKEKEIDIELIKSLMFLAEKDLEFIDLTSKDIKRDSVYWTFVFRDHYESLRGLIEAYLLFDGIEADSHQCKNAYICFRHPELELDWEFLEMVRIKRNNINYRGHLLKYDDWKDLKLKFELHISVLRKELEKKISETNTIE